VAGAGRISDGSGGGSGGGIGGGSGIGIGAACVRRGRARLPFALPCALACALPCALSLVLSPSTSLRTGSSRSTARWRRRRRCAGDRANRIRYGAGEAGEARAPLDVAVDSGYLPARPPAWAALDRVLALTWPWVAP
jgi:hypothetical protein